MSRDNQAKIPPPHPLKGRGKKLWAKERVCANSVSRMN